MNHAVVASARSRVHLSPIGLGSGLRLGSHSMSTLYGIAMWTFVGAAPAGSSPVYSQSNDMELQSFVGPWDSAQCQSILCAFYKRP